MGQLLFLAALSAVGAATAGASALLLTLAVVATAALGGSALGARRTGEPLGVGARRAAGAARPPPADDRLRGAPPHRLRDLAPDRAVAAVVVVLVLALTAVLAVSLVQRRDEVLVGDEALIALEAKEAPQGRPLIGKVTSAVLYGNLDQPHNPGPAERWALWPFVAALGGALGAWTFASLVNLGAMGIATLAAFRRGGVRWAGLSLVTCLLMYERTAPGGLTSVLNTRIVAMPLFATLVVAAMVLLGDSAMAIPLVVLAPFVAQTHVGYAPVAVAAVVTALGFLTARVLAAHRWSRPAAHLAIAMGLGVLLWLPALADQFAGSGNLGALARAQVPAAGWTRASAVLGAMLDPRVALLAPGEVRPSVLGWAPLPLTTASLVLLGALCWRSRARLRPLLPVFVLVAACIGAAMVTGWATPPSDAAGEHHYWFRAVALFGLYVLVLLVVPPSEQRRAPTGATSLPPATGGLHRRRWVLALGTASVIVAAAPLVRPPQRSSDERMAIDAVQELLPTFGALADGPQPLAIAHRGSWPAISTADGLLLELRDRGVAVTQVDGPVALDDRRVVVVTQGPTRPGEPLASTDRERTPAVELDAIAQEVHRWVRDHGPVRLTGPGRRDLEAALDGTATEVCPARYERDPSAVLDLDPLVLADLYAQRQVVAPELPDELTDRLGRWAQDRSVELRLASTVHAEDDHLGLLLSGSSC